jgi:hypothetical protein
MSFTPMTFLRRPRYYIRREAITHFILVSAVPASQRVSILLVSSIKATTLLSSIVTKRVPDWLKVNKQIRQISTLQWEWTTMKNRM